MFQKQNDTREKYAIGLGVAKGISSFAAVTIIPADRLYQVLRDQPRTDSAKCDQLQSLQARAIGQVFA